MNTYISLKAGALHQADIILVNDGKLCYIYSLDKSGTSGTMEISVTRTGPVHTYRVAKDYELKVLDNHTCPYCSGSGIYRGRGVIENGKFKGFEGTCFRCAGTGTESRKDRIRNSTYDCKYRKFYM